MSELEQGTREFLLAMTKALSTMSLYEEGHPQLEKALDALFLAFSDLQALTPAPAFTFLDGEVALDGQSMASLRGWEWGEKLAGIGMERIEILPNASREDLVLFLAFAVPRLQGIASDSPMPDTVRFGPVSAMGGGNYEDDTYGTLERLTAAADFSLQVETDLLTESFAQARDHATVHIAEVTAVVESLVAAMAQSQEMMVPLIRLKSHDQYTATHSINVAVLSMALAEYVGLGPDDVRLVGIGGVLHDIGKTRIPQAVLTKPGKLSDEELAIIRSHPEEGAKMILESDQSMELAAIMAYEHHIRYDGGGYPTPRFKRACHVASDLLHVCDVYDALATNRPYRKGWKSEKILEYIQEGAGSEFSPGLVRPFVQMMSEVGNELRIVRNLDEPPVPVLSE